MLEAVFESCDVPIFDSFWLSGHSIWFNLIMVMKVEEFELGVFWLHNNMRKSVLFFKEVCVTHLPCHLLLREIGNERFWL